MRMYNQSDKSLSWKMGNSHGPRTQYGCAPYGHVDIFEEHVEAAKVRGLPLAVDAVEPKVRAQRERAAAKATADASSEAQALEMAAELETQLNAVRKTVEEQHGTIRQSAAQVERLTAEVAQLVEDLDQAREERDAAITELADTTKANVIAQKHARSTGRTRAKNTQQEASAD